MARHCKEKHFVHVRERKWQYWRDLQQKLDKAKAKWEKKKAKRKAA